MKTMQLSAALGLLALAACSESIDAGGVDVDAGPDDDPLAIVYEPTVGSLDYLQKTIIQERCSGQPGLCHNGQFEPNLSTAANTYAYLVNRPGLEKRDRLRVDPGNPNASLLIDKLRNRDVSTQMPLGADPLSEEELQMFEDWISDGALRRPGASAAPTLNNPPLPPEIAVYDDGTTRLDMSGPFTVSAGSTVVLRHSVEDYETDDSAIGFATFLLSNTDGRNVALTPSAQDPQNGVTVYDAAGPMGNGDLLNYRFSWTIPTNVDLVDDQGGTETVPAAGLVLTPIVLYLDEFPTGFVRFAVSTRTMTIE